jgi:bifunctional ADP-heptose synthase (sugar kinase/adenylyltransferase)
VAAGLVVMKRGTATVTADELRAAIAGSTGLAGSPRP